MNGSLTNEMMADVVRCSKRTISARRRKYLCFGSDHAPQNHGGRPPSITRRMGDALRRHLLAHPGLQLEELVGFLWKEFRHLSTTSTVSRYLKSTGWSQKKPRRVAKEQNPDLRDAYLHKMSSFHSYHIVYVNESGLDKRIGLRRTAWAPIGVTPIQIAKFHRGQRYNILPAFSQRGILKARVLPGSIDGQVFEAFIEDLLPSMGRYPAPESVLVMDNAPIHHTERIQQMCDEAGVILVYLPPYSPNLNPIEEFFAELKAFIQREWKYFEEDPEHDLGAFLEGCIDIVGKKEKGAKGHFRHAGWIIEEP